ncbi:MAG: hypothetical protein ABW158_01455, partial [Candidatus Thiodiazotropha sp. 6PDIVS]
SNYRKTAISKSGYLGNVIIARQSCSPVQHSPRESLILRKKVVSTALLTHPSVAWPHSGGVEFTLAATDCGETKG